MKKRISYILLIVATVIWGLAFVAQKAATVIPPFTVGTIRSLLATLFLICLIPLTDRLTKNGRRLFNSKKNTRLHPPRAYRRSHTRCNNHGCHRLSAIRHRRRNRCGQGGLYHCSLRGGCAPYLYFFRQKAAYRGDHQHTHCHSGLFPAVYSPRRSL